MAINGVGSGAAPAGGTSGGAAAGGPTPAESKQFKDGLAKMSQDDLVNGLKDPSLEAWKKDAIALELKERQKVNDPQEAQDASDALGGEGKEDEEIKKLMKKLQDGTITAEEMEKLSKALGVPVEELKGLKGGANAGGDDAGGDPEIQGG
jgi:hypothetical protein